MPDTAPDPGERGPLAEGSSTTSHEAGRWSSMARLHIPFVIGVPGCLFAGWFELTRALAGRQVAWVYAFEWPLFAILGTYIWWRQAARQPTPPRPEGRLSGCRATRPRSGCVAGTPRQAPGRGPARRPT